MDEDDVSLDALIASLDTGQSMAELAEATIDAIIASHPPLNKRLLFPAIFDEVRRRSRGKVRYIEHSGKPTDPIADRKLLLKERFYCRGQGYVEWGKATIVQHSIRLEWLQGQIDGLQITADRHAAAIEEIRACPGAKCLNDVARKRKRAS